MSNTDWNISSDIYGIVESIDELKKKFIEDEDETTLSLGIFGFLTDTEAKKIQTSIIMAGELGNEMFPQRAKLDKNITTHAMYCNVDNLNATPSHMTINLAIKEEDLDNYMKDNTFIFDHKCPIYIGDYEFHLDYDIILSRRRNTKNTDWYYNARYDVSEPNHISDIVNPYLKQPYTVNFNNYTYIFFQTIVRQVTIETTEDKMITASVIDNKSFTFSFDNQLADFDVYITEKNKTTRLTPYVYGSSLEPGERDYCWYLYMNDHNIRIGFDSSSYLPGLNADIKIVAKTTLGEEGNFSYKVADENSGFYVDFESSFYNYKKITCFARCATDATDGVDKKSTEELKTLVPKMAMSRGYITTETDLNNYFNLISTKDNILKLQKKVDNQLNRIWYCYLLMKDAIGNIIPTNTLPVKVDIDGSYMVNYRDGDRYIIPASQTFVYDASKGYAVPCNESEIPEKYSEEYYNNNGIYYYRSPYNIVINSNPIYCAYYLTIVNEDGYFEYNYINPNMFMGFIVNTCHFERSLLSRKNEYRFTFNMQQSVMEDLSLYYKFNDNDNEIIVNNMKVFLVLYDGADPYRYAEATLTAYDEGEYISTWEVKMTTDNEFDTENKLKLLDLFEVGYDTKNYGFFDDNCKAEIYIYGKFDGEYGRYSSDSIIPNMEGYSLVNIYTVADGLQLFNNFTNVMNTRIKANRADDQVVKSYDISGIPLVGEHFMTSEDNVTYFIHELIKKKAHIDYCLTVLENNMDIDFKYFNTYGDSKTYHIGDKEQTPLGNIDITMKFRVKLANSSNSIVKQEIIQYIKDYIEDLNELGDLHIPNLLHDIKEEFGDLIIYIEYMNFNNNRLGVNHIELKEVDDIKTVPEFISIRNRYNVDKSALEPCIDLEIVL